MMIPLYHYRAVAVSADGRWAAACGRAVQADVYDAAAGRHVRTLPETESAAFSADGRLVAGRSGLGSRRTVRVYDTGTGAGVASLGGPDGTLTDSLVFPGDGRQVWATFEYDRVAVWDVPASPVR